jgi:cellobiose-specific phosphotransferase system component IIA
MAKTPEYRLQALVEIREREKDAAEEAFAEAQKALREQ